MQHVNGTTEIEGLPGDIVRVTVYGPGPAGLGRRTGELVGMLLHAGRHESDVIVHPGLGREALAELLRMAGVDLGDIREGPVYVLRNCQNEQLTFVQRPGEGLGLSS